MSRLGVDATLSAIECASKNGGMKLSKYESSGIVRDVNGHAVTDVNGMFIPEPGINGVDEFVKEVPEIPTLEPPHFGPDDLPIPTDDAASIGKAIVKGIEKIVEYFS